MKIRDFLLFKNLNDNEADFIKPLLKRKKFKKGEMVFSEGELGAEMYLIEKGEVRIYLKRGDYNLELAKLGAGDFFGEMALLRVYDRSANVEVLEDSIIHIMSINVFKQIMEKDPNISVKVLTSLCNILADRLAQTNNNLETHFLLNKAILNDKMFRDLYITKNKGK
jgi:CRP/FNR family transcriptional regulator